MNQEQPMILQLVQDNWDFIKRLAFYLIIAGILYWLAKEFRGTVAYQHFIALLTQGTSWIIDLIGIDHTLQRAFLREGNGNDMVVTDVINNRLVVDRDYDGFYPLIMLLPALIVWPGVTLGKKLFFILASSVFLMLCTLLRIVTTVAVDHYLPLHYDLAHFYVTPILLIFLPILLCFLYWVRIAGRSDH